MKKTFMYISPDFEVVEVDGNVVMGLGSDGDIEEEAGDAEESEGKNEGESDDDDAGERTISTSDYNTGY